MTILCEFDPAAVPSVSELLPGTVRVAANLPEAAIEVAQNPAENLVIIGWAAPLDQAFSFMQVLRDQGSHAVVILERRDPDGEILEAARRAGVREVVAAGETGTLVEAAMRAVGVHTPDIDEDAPMMPLSEMPVVDPPVTAPEADVPEAEQEGEPAKRGIVVTVFSPKGGSGKTTISTNLAVALSDTGATVCIVDLDLEFGDVAISLQLTPTRSLVDAVTTDVEGDEKDAVRALTTPYRPGLDAILAPIEPGDAERIPADLVPDLISVLRSMYDYVVIDTPSQFSAHVLAALDSSEHHVLLTNPEVPSIKNLRLTLDMLDLLHYAPQRRSIVFNRADNAAGLGAAEVEQTLKTPITVTVPASRDVPGSINKGVPIVAAQPDHPVSVAIRDFAQTRIIGEPLAKKRRRGLFRRRSA